MLQPANARARFAARTLLFAVCCLSLGFVIPVPSRGEEQTPVDYATQIAPILDTYCVGCHIEGDAGGGLVLESYSGLVAGGERGPAITPGAAESSRMWMMVAGLMEPKMPPDDMEGPSEAELELLARWIAEGAPGPATDAPSVPVMRTPTIEPHSDVARPVTALALSPDGRALAVARFAEVELWDPETLTVVRPLASQPGKVTDLRFSSDGTRLVIASGVAGLYGVASIVRVEDGHVEHTLRGHRDVLYAAAMSPDGRTVATGGYDRDVTIWDLESAQPRHVLTGHNGAIFDLAFCADGKVLATASADETVKLWRVEDGARLDTLSQPQGEVWTVAFTPDDQSIVAASADNRFRAWRFESRTEPRINALVDTRFADESPLVRIAFTRDGRGMIVASQAGRIGLFDTQTWNKIATLPEAGDAVTDVAIALDASQGFVATMAGEVARVSLAGVAEPSHGARSSDDAGAVEEVYLVLDGLTESSEPEGASHASPETAIELPRGAAVTGVIASTEGGDAEVDWYRFSARRGEVWMVETRASQDGSPLDSIVEVRDAVGEPITRVRLQAVRDSYFTFRGKDSAQSNDFRMFAWEEMELDDYLYSAGEVTRLWMYPRGPDSGFNVYPGTGARHTFFDTSPITHALQEPAYIVRPLNPGESPLANGLPEFSIEYVNDDDASRQAGTDSRLRFTAPEDGTYTIRVTDTRNLGGPDHRYRLTVRPAAPDFQASVSKVDQPIPAGAGREFRVSVQRIDGFEGPVVFEVTGVPEGLNATETVVVEAGQQEAYGVVWADDGVSADQTFDAPVVTARAQVLGRVLEHSAGDLGPLRTAAAPRVRLAIEPEGDDPSASTDGGVPRLTLRAGETISAVARVWRNGHDGEISLGNEFAGRNLPHGVFVDNIGLNGLMVLKGQDRQPFFITASKIAAPGERRFHLKAEMDGGIAAIPVVIEVLPVAPR